MVLRDPASTKNKILDAAERIYADEGVESLTLRVITERAGVNLASVNYHFGNKEALTQAMLNRVLTPLNEERLALLFKQQHALGPAMRPAHVAAAILLPLMRELTSPELPAHRVAFHVRSASDPAPMVRNYVSEAYRDAAAAFDQAFIQTTPNHSPHEAVWRSHLFFNAFPGVVCNQNTGAMLSELLLRPSVTARDVLVHFGTVIECVTTGNNDAVEMDRIADEIVAVLRDTRTLADLAQTFQLTPEDAPRSPLLEQALEANLAGVVRLS